MPGMAQAKRTQQRDEAFAVQADFAEQAIHQERGSGEIAAVFQNGEEEKQQRDLRDKDDDNAHAVKDAIIEQVAQWARGHVRRCPSPERFDASLDGVHDWLGEPEQCDEQQAHDGGENQKSPEFVDQDFVDALRQRSRRRIRKNADGPSRPQRQGSCAVGNLLDPLVMCLNVSLHRIDAKGVQTARRRRKQRSDRLMLAQFHEHPRHNRRSTNARRSLHIDRAGDWRRQDKSMHAADRV